MYMCGIIGYSGHRAACGVLLEGLGRLEYRGYDSAGILIAEGDRFVAVKCEGRLDNLRRALDGMTLDGVCGMGHTRWATHGGPSDHNAHPHGTGRVMLVHNGIIENYPALREELVGKGYRFSSQTDTEIAACMVDSCYRGDPVAAIRQALGRIEGSYAFVMMFSEHPNTLYAVRKDGPLIAALGENENFLASDATAIIGYTRRFFTLDEGEIAVVTPDGITVIAPDGGTVEKPVQIIDWNIEQAQKTGYDHFMRKEIDEQPAALRRTLHPRVRQNLPCFACDGLDPDFFGRFARLRVAACGTAMHAGLVGRHVIEQLARIPVEVDIASEFRYGRPILRPDDLVVIVSQSGETADSLAALRLAKSMGVETLAIVNVAGSSIAREADHVIITHAAGPEISVASTKAYSVQMAIFYLMAISLGLANGRLTDAQAGQLTEKLLGMPDAVRGVLAQEDCICAAAGRLQGAEHLFFIGRGLDWALACEGSLKLKEISYIHSEAYAAGELKHGTIALITQGMPIVALATQQSLMPKMLSNIKEFKARGADITLLTSSGGSLSEDVADSLILLDALDDLFMPFPTVTALQLIAYFVARGRGCDIDKPRNLAKSVTVE
jgi:glucosamine--fructose-6-phosphate aminotransferase (isomerizing)